MHRNIKQQLLTLGAENSDKLVKSFLASCEHEGVIYDIEQTYHKIRKLNNTKAPHFSFPDNNGDTLALNDFKGKNIIVGVWSSSCSSCIKDMIAIRDKIETKGEKNREFLF